MKKVLVFGCGYVGTELCKTLLEKGYKVRASDNFYKGHCDALLNYATHPNFEFMFADATNPIDVQKAIKDVDVIIFLVSLVGAPMSDRYPTLSRLMTVESAETIMKYKPKHIPLFYSGTGSSYGALAEVCTEESPTNPTSTYGRDKLLAEQAVLSGENTCVYRFATAYGPSGNTRVNLLINDLVFQAVTNKVLVIFQGDYLRTFIHVSDMASSIVFWLNNYPNFKHRIYNVGSNDSNFTKREIAEKIKEKTGCLVIYEEVGKDPDLRNYACSFKRINDEGWSAKWKVDDGIDQLIKTIPLLQMRNPYS